MFLPYELIQNLLMVIYSLEKEKCVLLIVLHSLMVEGYFHIHLLRAHNCDNDIANFYFLYIFLGD